MQPRHNMFRNVHKGIRRELARVLADAGSLDLADRAEVTKVVGHWQLAKTLLEAHHHHEDVHVGPHLCRLVPSLFSEMEKDHLALEREIAAVDENAGRMTAGPDDEAAEATRAFYLGLAALVGRYFIHMDREERVFVSALQDAYTDQELAAIEEGLVASVEPTLLSSFFAVMVPAMNPGEREELLVGVRQNAPPLVFNGMCSLSRSVLSKSAWANLEARLSVGSTS